MKIKINRKFLGGLILIGFLFLLVTPVLAQGIVPCGHDKACTLCDLIVGIKKLFDYGLKIIAVITLACATFAGVMYVVSSGNEKTMESAKAFLSASLIGLAVVLGSWLIVNTTIAVLMPTKSDLGTGKASWYQFGDIDCTTGTTGATGALEINTATASSSLSEGKAGEPYISDPITVTGAKGSIDWSVDGQPAGLDIKSISDTTSVISGTPDATAAGTYLMTVTATDTGKVSMNNPGSIIFGTPVTFAAGTQSVSKQITLTIKTSNVVVSTCINSYCKGTTSKLTEVRNGAGTCDNSQTFYNNSSGICGPGYGPGVVCCDGDWWVDTRGGNWDSSCNNKVGGLQAGGWYLCNDGDNISNPTPSEKNTIRCVIQNNSGNCQGTNSKITGVTWNGLDRGMICCDGNWWQKAAPVTSCSSYRYVCDTNWTGDCNGLGNGLRSGGFYQCGDDGNSVAGGTPTVTVSSPNRGGTFPAGSIIPLRWQTSGFVGQIAQIKINLNNISISSSNNRGGSYGLFKEAADDGSEDLITNADTLFGQYFIRVTACDSLGENCVYDDSEPFNIVAANR